MKVLLTLYWLIISSLLYFRYKRYAMTGQRNAMVEGLYNPSKINSTFRELSIIDGSRSERASLGEGCSEKKHSRKPVM